MVKIIIMYMYCITLLLYYLSSCRMYVVASWAFGLLDLRIKLLTSYFFSSYTICFWNKWKLIPILPQNANFSLKYFAVSKAYTDKGGKNIIPQEILIHSLKIMDYLPEQVNKA